MTITLYGMTYVSTTKEMVAGLFKGAGTANGMYKLRSDGVYLSDGKGELRAFIPRRKDIGPVSASRLHTGRVMCMFSLSSVDERWMNKPKSYADFVNEARNLIHTLEPAFP